MQSIPLPPRIDRLLPRLTPGLPPLALYGRAGIFWIRLALTASVLIPSIFFGLSAWHDYRLAVSDAREHTGQVARLAREHALQVFEINEVMAGRVRDLLNREEEAGEVEPHERERRLHGRLKEIAATIPQVESIWIWNSDGRPLASTRFFPVPAQLSIAGQDHFEAQKRPGVGIFASEPHLERYSNETFFNISRRREARDGRFMGIISIGLSVRAFSSFYRDTQLDLVRRLDLGPDRGLERDPDGNSSGHNAGPTLTLARSDGVILVRYPDPPAPGERLQILDGSEDGLIDKSIPTIPTRSGIWFSAQRKVGVLPLHVDASVSRSASLKKWRSDLRRPGLFSMLAAATLAALSWLALTQALRGQYCMSRYREEAEQRQAAEAALRQSQKLEAIGQLTGGVAHDFNNLLMIVSTNLHILRLKTASGTIERELAAIGRAVCNGQSLTRQLMAFSRRQATLQIELVELGERMPFICELIKHSLRPGIKLHCEVAPGTWPVRVDISELELALLNLAVNARDAMPEGGEINIQVSNLRLDGSLNPVDPLTGEFVGILVQDTGHGVPAEVIERVFEPFFTTKDVGKGTGLGLSQVYGFAKHSGGTAMINSRPPQGATVTIFLPRAPEPLLTCEAPARGLILVAEANPAVGESIEALLQQLGYRVQLKQDTLDVLEALTSGAAFDLLLADVAMPGGMSGVELVRVVRVRFPELPVILMTGYGASDPRVLEEGLPVLAKPFDMQALIRALEQKPGCSVASTKPSFRTA